MCTLNVQVANRPVSGWGFTDLRGHIGPAIVEGRAPRTPNEVALGAKTLTGIGKHRGDRVTVSGPGGSARYRIVGQTLLSRLGDPEPLADGAVFTGPGAKRVDEKVGESNSSSWNLVARVTSGPGRAATVRKLHKIARLDTPPIGPVVPAEIDRVRQIDRLPVAVAAFVAVVALVAVGYALVMAVRRRRRDLAVLKAIGFDRGQVRATIVWHASTIAVVGLVIGVPLGLVVGQFVWGRIADELGVAGDPTWPMLAIALLVPIVVLLVNVVAAFPASGAARTRPAIVLRSE